jgi:hypothetical protein
MISHLMPVNVSIEVAPESINRVQSWDPTRYKCNAIWIDSLILRC